MNWGDGYTRLQSQERITGNAASTASLDGFAPIMTLAGRIWRKLHWTKLRRGETTRKVVSKTPSEQENWESNHKLRSSCAIRRFVQQFRTIFQRKKIGSAFTKLIHAYSHTPRWLSYSAQDGNQEQRRNCRDDHKVDAAAKARTAMLRIAPER